MPSLAGAVRSNAGGINMTKGKTGRRPLFWEGSAKRDFKQFPEAVQKDMGVASSSCNLAGRHHLQNPGRGSGRVSMN